MADKVRDLLDSPLRPSPLNDERKLPLMKVDECAHDFIEWYWEYRSERTGKLTWFGWCPCCWWAPLLSVREPQTPVPFCTGCGDRHPEPFCYG